MYSILRKNGASSFVYVIDEGTGKPFAGNLAETKELFNELLQTYPISSLVIVHNCNVTAELTIEDVQ